MATLQSVIDRAINVAASKGLSASHRVPVVIELSGVEVMLIVSYDEPYSIEAPLNLVWINGDSTSADYKVARKRASRVVDGSFTHTWVKLTDYQQISLQYWDTPIPDDNDHNLHDTNVDNPHRVTAEQTNALSLLGGKMLGALGIRTLKTGEDYAADEAVPRSWIEAALAKVNLLATQIKQAQGGILSQLASVRRRLDALELGVGAGTKGFTYQQVEAQTIWKVQHGLTSKNLNVTIYDEEDKLVLTDVAIEDDGHLTITFAVPTAGKAQIQPVGV